MEKHEAYCSAHDRLVHVIVRAVTYDEVDGTVPGTPGIVCVEHGEDCQGVHCPLSDRPPRVTSRGRKGGLRAPGVRREGL